MSKLGDLTYRMGQAGNRLFFDPEIHAQLQIVRAKPGRRRSDKRKVLKTINPWVSAAGKLMLWRFGFRCAYCQADGPLTGDHFYPISKGGSKDEWNVVPACWPCNQKKSNFPAEDVFDPVRVGFVLYHVEWMERLLKPTEHHAKYLQPSRGRRGMTTAPIYFYSKSSGFACFSNFYAACFVEDGVEWPTTEAFYQAYKFRGTNEERVTQIRRAFRARDAFYLGKDPEWLRPDWESIKLDVMRLALLYKFTQNPHLGQVLVGTLDRQLIEDSPTDYFWGCGADQSGQNWLGQLLMELRSLLQQGPDAVENHKVALRQRLPA